MAARKTKRDIPTANRISKALQLRAQKLTYAEIAQQAGYASASGAYHAVQRELNRTIETNVDRLRVEEVAMLDKLHSIVWPLAIGANGKKTSLYAVDRVVSIAQLRAKLLGLEVPSREAVVERINVIVRETPPGFLTGPAIIEQEQQ